MNWKYSCQSVANLQPVKLLSGLEPAKRKQGIFQTSLCKVLKDPEPRMRVQAIRASETLYKAGDKSFAADYAKLASDKDSTVAIQALMTMNLLKTPDSATVAKATMDANKAAGIQLVAGTILNPAAAAAGRGGGRPRVGSGVVPSPGGQAGQAGIGPPPPDDHLGARASRENTV